MKTINKETGSYGNITKSEVSNSLISDKYLESVRAFRKQYEKMDLILKLNKATRDAGVQVLKNTINGINNNMEILVDNIVDNNQKIIDKLVK